MIPTAFGVLAGSSGLGANSWDPAKKNGNLTLSVMDTVVTATVGGSWKSVLALNASFGTTIFTIVGSGTGPFPICGLGNTSAALTTYPGGNTSSMGLNSLGDIYYNATPIGNVGFTLAMGNTLATEIDPSNTRVRWTKNGGSPSAWQSYSGMVTGAVYPQTALFDSGDVATTTF